MTASSKYIYGTFCQILLPLCLQSCNSLFRIMIFNYSPFYFCYPQVKRHLDYFTTDREVSLYLLSTKIHISLSFSLWLPLFSYFFVLLTYFPFIFIFPTYPLPTALLTSWPLDHRHKEPLQLPQEWDFSWVSAVIQSGWYFHQLSPTSPS